MRLIDADKLKEYFPHDTDWHCPVNTNSYVVETIESIPTVDAVPVVHGRWVAHTLSEVTGYDPVLSGDDPVCSYSCSVCGEDCYVSDTGDDILSNYCPNCGAKMDERKEE